jgi:hypothetical protein
MRSVASKTLGLFWRVFMICTAFFSEREKSLLSDWNLRIREAKKRRLTSKMVPHFAARPLCHFLVATGKTSLELSCLVCGRGVSTVGGLCKRPRWASSFVRELC